MPSEVSAAGLPFKEAVAFFRGKVPAHSQHWTDVWRTAHSRSFMVAGAASEALLADFQQSLRKALESGTTLAEFRRDFDGIVARHGWVYNGGPAWRSQIIYETNLSTAYSAGRYAQLTEPATRELYPYWQYVHSGSSHPRLQHLAWNGLTLRCDDAFWDTHFPPNGWRCGCRVRPVSEGGLRRMGRDAPDDAPPLVTRPWVNPKTGELHQVPVGIDPGFDYNPGKAWKSGLKDVPVRSPNLRPLRPQPKQPTDAQQDALRAFLREPPDRQRGGEAVAGAMSEPVRQLLGAHEPEVRLSAETMAKQRMTHPELSEDDYLLLPLLIADPALVLSKGARRLALLNAGGKTLVAILKVDQLRDRNYLVSLYRADPKSVRRLLRHNAVLLGEIANVLRQGQ